LRVVVWNLLDAIFFTFPVYPLPFTFLFYTTRTHTLVIRDRCVPQRVFPLSVPPSFPADSLPFFFSPFLSMMGSDVASALDFWSVMAYFPFSYIEYVFFIESLAEMLPPFSSFEDSRSAGPDLAPLIRKNETSKIVTLSMLLHHVILSPLLGSTTFFPQEFY